MKESLKLRTITKVLKVAANEKRLMILQILLDGRAREIGEISELVNLPYKTTARNLKILERCDFLKSNVNNGLTYYVLNNNGRLIYNSMIITMLKD